MTEHVQIDRKGADPAAMKGGISRTVLPSFAEVRAECQAMTAAVAMRLRGDRAWLVVTGKDRATWLHNLTTNAVKTLQPGDGNYAFALNIQGRILFDLNILIFKDFIGLDIDRSWLPSALAHFNKYTITEDVSIADRSADFARMALIGPGVLDYMSRKGFRLPGNLALLAPFETHVDGVSQAMIAFRSDFCGPLAIELLVPSDDSGRFSESLMEQGPDAPPSASESAIQVCRIEHGVPWPGREITSEYLPAETRQLARAVSYQKGCYLGQEVVERMRSRQVVARQLVLLKLNGAEVPCVGAEVLSSEAKPIGSVTSSCHSIVHAAPIALAYVKTAFVVSGTAVKLSWDGRVAEAVVVDLPSATVH